MPKTPMASYARFLPDATSLIFSVIDGSADDRQIWRVTLADGSLSRVTLLSGRHGNLSEGFAVDGKNVYFTWREDEGDIWVMDVARR